MSKQKDNKTEKNKIIVKIVYITYILYTTYRQIIA